jgi:hypothetical protein
MSPVRIRTNARTRILVAMFAAPLLAISVASCASGASGGGDATSAPKSESELAKSALAWDTAKAECLRGEGIDVPDPKGGSGGSRQGIALDAGQDMAAVSAAMETCQKKVTDERGERPVTAAEKKQNAEAIEKSRKMTACLREKGYDMPDGQPGSGGTITSQVGPEIPEDVMKACGMGDGAITKAR